MQNILTAPLRGIGRLITASLKNFDPGKMLDSELVKAEARKPVGTQRVPAGEGATKRRPFTSGVYWPQTGFSKLSFKQFTGLLHTGVPMMVRLRLSRRYYSKTIVPTQHIATDAMFEELEKLAREMGAVDIGYISNIDPNLVFKGKELPHPHAIVFTVEMDKDEMKTAPSFESFVEVKKAYLKLGKTSQVLTQYLRDKGFAAYPGTNLGGISDYTAVAEQAGLGAIGYHGLLIGPDGGARLRINTIYTNIANLPARKNPHLWIRDFCAECLNCVRKCPPQAIYSKPRPKSNGGAGIECISYQSCLQYFSENFSCAICVKVCPFSVSGYDKIKNGFEQSKQRNLTATKQPAA
ncbi:MAG: hypothetical protein CMF31_06505 [Kordiimonas sp.]|nr:hypothetical protein [Kordiimonas sp.]